jgi:hypothetical protein
MTQNIKNKTVGKYSETKLSLYFFLRKLGLTVFTSKDTSIDLSDVLKWVSDTESKTNSNEIEIF